MAFGEKQTEIDRLTAENARQAYELEIARAAGHIAAQVEQAITEYTTTGGADQAARDMAYSQVVATEKERVTRETRDSLLAAKRADFVAEYRKKEGATIRTAVDAKLQADGTYNSLRGEAEDSVRTEIREELLEVAKAQAATEVDTPENRERFISEIRPGVEGSFEVQELRRTTRQELEGKWRQEVHEDVRASVETEEAAREGDFKTKYERTYRESSDFLYLQRRTRAGLEQTWGNKTIEDVNAVLGDEELAALLTEKARLAKEKLTRENRATELLREFEGGGIDVHAIGRGSNLIIELGTIRKERPSNTYGDTPFKPTLYRQRRLEFYALGEGRFRVRGDSLRSSKSVWERTQALDEGTIITIGNRQTENGQQRLEPYLLADAHLQFDDDTTTPATFVEMPVPVANVVIDGISAREIHERKAASE